ncbi:MAG: zinc ribbon domain-containing protein [Acidobacteriota bacterium]
MAKWCPNCGRNVDEDEKFCRQCGMPQHLEGEEATTWILSPQAESARETTPVQPGLTSPAMPPAGVGYSIPTLTPYYPPPYPTQYQPPVQTGQPHISLGDWLSGGWQVYKENWALMSLATLLGGLLSAATAGILAGPLLMGMFRMAFKTMRGERPEIGDLFNWRGYFLQAFLTALIFGAIYIGLGGIGNNNAFFGLLSAAATPLLFLMVGFTTSHILERGWDVAKAINQVARLVFSRDAFMWWVVGLVFAAISVGGVIGCGIGALITLPWMISATAVAYRDVFGIDDPNRTNH